MEMFFIVIYGLCMLLMMVYSLGQMHLALMYKKAQKYQDIAFSPISGLPDPLPFVTIQLPLYNEIYVAERLLDAVSQIDWPTNKMEIQVLDDSTDRTTEIIRDKMAQLQRDRPGLAIRLIRRPDRSGYKAGALQVGLEKSQGRFIAIFDADFVPSHNFLRETMPSFKEETVGMVQTCWEHLNQGFSLLTQLQAFGLNGHFSVEQTGRSVSGSFINFNGTAGIWRKRCILDAGGWQSDTLTEDLDLSYRAQMKGWKFKYLENVKSPAELPVTMSAVKSQQFRWTKGGAETARKNLWNVLRSPLRWQNKIHAFFHLTNSTNFLFLLIASVLSVPLILVKYHNPSLKMEFNIGSIFIIGFLAISYFYWIAVKYNTADPGKSYMKYFPLFMVFSMGLSFHNGVAALEGLLGKKTPFIRTPKFNIVGVGSSWEKRHNIYYGGKFNWRTAMEGLLCLYFIVGIVVGFLVQDYGLMFFHLMLALGYAGIFYYSIKN